MEVKRYTTSDGRRIEDIVTRNELPDGQVEQVVETREELVPMKVTRKVTQKMASVPVEERVELFGDDGSVQTTVKNLSPSALSFTAGEVNLRDVVDRLDNLTTALTRPVVAPKTDFVSKLRSMAAPTTTAETPSNASKAVIVVMWTAAAVVAALIGYSALM